MMRGVHPSCISSESRIRGPNLNCSELVQVVFGENPTHANRVQTGNCRQQAMAINAPLEPRRQRSRFDATSDFSLSSTIPNNIEFRTTAFVQYQEQSASRDAERPRPQSSQPRQSAGRRAALNGPYSCNVCGKASGKISQANEH
jgi:hypothetical protein